MSSKEKLPRMIATIPQDLIFCEACSIFMGYLTVPRAATFQVIST
jgi:hypothetical protein